jgi:hypothetical protein
MELHEIEVTIDRDGNVKLHVQGALGTVCTDLTADLEAAVGEVVSRDLTPEAYDTPQHQQLDQRTQS